MRAQRRLSLLVGNSSKKGRQTDLSSMTARRMTIEPSTKDMMFETQRLEAASIFQKATMANFNSSPIDKEQFDVESNDTSEEHDLDNK